MYERTGSLSGGAAAANVPRQPSILEELLSRQEAHFHELQTTRQRLADLADRLRGTPVDANKVGTQPPREVPGSTIRKFEMLTEDTGATIAQILEHLSRLEVL